MKLRSFNTFLHIALDYITHFETSETGNSYLLTIIDLTTQYGNTIPVKTLTAEGSIDKLLSHHQGLEIIDCNRLFCTQSIN